MPKPAFLFILFTFTFILFSCGKLQIIKRNTHSIATVDNNVCKKLYGHVVLYAIFVDTRYTQPWSEHDIKSTLDSIYETKRWLEKMATENGASLSIDVKIHQNGKTIPIVHNFPNRTLSQTLYSPFPYYGVPKLDRWSDVIARTAGLSLPKDTSKMVKTLNRLTSRERLIARLRDIHQTDNVALLYFVNDYYSEDLSVAIHTGSSVSPEYAIVSYKRPSTIAHEFLHLFGALDLYFSPFEKKRKILKKKAWVEKHFPDEVMGLAYRRLDSLTISPFTKYLIGWDNELDEKTRKSILGKKIKVVKY